MTLQLSTSPARRALVLKRTSRDNMRDKKHAEDEDMIGYSARRIRALRGLVLVSSPALTLTN